MIMVAVAIPAAITAVESPKAKAEPVIDITKGNVEPMPIAIPDFYGSQTGADIARVVSADLERSGLFKPISPQAFIQDNASLQQGPRFQDWRVLNAQALVSGAAQSTANGQVQVQFRLWDVFGESQMTGFQYNASQNNWRRVAHQIADEIYKRITGEEGYFDSRVVYVSESGPKNARVKRLAIMDQDGENHRYLTDGAALVLTPRFSPVSQDITYMSFYNNKPRVYLFNINTGQQEILGDFPGMTFAPRFSPDGSKVIMSMAQNGNTDIYEMDTRTRRSRRLTDNPAIDTSPSYSPDGGRIVFNSDRGGEQQLYVMNADGSGVQRISKGQGRYATPVWSPRGDLIAFTRMAQGQFYIGVMRPDGSGERQLSSGWLVEGPTWAPNGRVLAYFVSDPSGRTQLHSIDLTGYNERVMKTPLDGSDPAWSPLLSSQ
ncbi:Tol-Pal system beta propeller repeat protein TolB [Dongia soli]|uniref:Tol-Pal system protein TolB n=2 Tax=Dongia soli TaxID=600628 RepID=A0ABU5EAV4_9PROT|nr:Tol-Pal system beta propeller repeat protein TolB [Dongia soli]MDY0883379.1 Tol-Pal system beta propeller repeat protein TolB [Dongia soli]